MAPPRNLPDDIAPTVAEWIKEKKTQKDIIALLSSKFGISCSRQTLTRRMKEWNLSIRKPHTDTEQLRERIRTIFSSDRVMQERELLQVLQGEGFQITGYRLAQIRLDMGLRRRT